MDASKIAKIEALLKKAESTSFEAEAETYYAKAQELMALWAIDEAMLRSGKKDKGKVIHETMILNKSGYWKSNLTLISCLARPNNVQTLVTVPKGAGSKPVVHLIGFEEDVSAVKMLFTSMLIQNQRMRRLVMPSHLISQKEKTPWVRGFIEGFSHRIEVRLAEMKREMEDIASVKYGSDSLLPVLASKSQAVSDAMSKMFPNLGVLRGRPRIDFDGAFAGLRAADSADIGQKRAGAGNGGALNR